MTDQQQFQAPAVPEPPARLRRMVADHYPHDEKRVVSSLAASAYMSAEVYRVAAEASTGPDLGGVVEACTVVMAAILQRYQLLKSAAAEHLGNSMLVATAVARATKRARLDLDQIKGLAATWIRECRSMLDADRINRADRPSAMLVKTLLRDLAGHVEAARWSVYELASLREGRPASSLATATFDYLDQAEAHADAAHNSATAAWSCVDRIEKATERLRHALNSAPRTNGGAVVIALDVGFDGPSDGAEATVSARIARIGTLCLTAPRMARRLAERADELRREAAILRSKIDSTFGRYGDPHHD